MVFNNHLIKRIITFLLATLFTLTMFTLKVSAKPKGEGGKGRNTAPVITQDTAAPEILEDSVIPAATTLNAIDKENNTFTWSIISVSLGKAILSGETSAVGSGSITVLYTPVLNQNGTGSVTVQAKDNKGAASTITVYVKITPVNDPPVNTVLPVISGTYATGQTVNATNGTWTDVETPAADLVYTYQWQESVDQNGTNSVAISGAIGNSLSLTSSLSGKYINVLVTATDKGDGSALKESSTAASTWVKISAEAQFYVALGDSIAAGTDNRNVLIGNSYAYTNTLSQSLSDIFSGTPYSYKNHAMPGDKTSDLLSKLKTNLIIRSNVANATIITISIGGNNVLSAGSREGYSKLNDAEAKQGVNMFITDLPQIVNEINNLHTPEHRPQIYIMDLYNTFHPLERGWVLYADGNTEEGYMHDMIYEKYLSLMHSCIDDIARETPNVYRVNTYSEYENNDARFQITAPELVKTDSIGSYFYSPYIEKTMVYSDAYTRFDIYPFVPILWDYLNIDKYRDPHPKELGHNVLRDAHLKKFMEVNFQR